jgi:sugar lactone lactonase YvrE
MYNNRIRKVTPAGVINTVAGNSTGGFAGDGGPAVSAQLGGPWGVAVDAAGNLYIADTNNNRIRKVTLAGVISTVAGNGTWGFAGDGGPATAAQLNSPWGIAEDGGGNIYIADMSNNRIRKVTPAGVISTVAGNGNSGFSGDGGPATSAGLNYPSGVAVDAAGNFYIADFNNNRIRKVTVGGVISTVAGNGTAGFGGDGGYATSAQLRYPYGVAVDAAGNLYIADSSNSRIRKVTSGGVISTVAGNGTYGFSGDGGPAASAGLYYPRGVLLDAGGNLFIADAYNNRIRKVTSGGVISTVAGNGAAGFSGDGGPATSAELYLACGVAVDTGGNLYIADYANSRIRKVTPAGVISTVAGNGNSGFSGDGGPATSAQIFYPTGVVVDSGGSLYIADYNNSRIRKVTPPPRQSIDLALTSGGAATAATVGGMGSLQAGYAVVNMNSGSPPYGTAVFSLAQSGVVVSEVGVPASAPTQHGRIFIDFRSGVAAKSDEVDAGTISINTGMALVNRGSGTAHITFGLQDGTGAAVPGSLGTGSLASGAHTALFIDQLGTFAMGFNLPSNFSATTKFGTLDISSDQPLSILALRLTNNQRGEALLTSTPIADMTQASSTAPLYFPQFADGGGYTTSIFLLNNTTSPQTGSMRLSKNDGTPLIIHPALPVGWSAGSYFAYSIPPGGFLVFQSDGSPPVVTAGSVQVIPDPLRTTPAGAGVFELTQGGILVTESGIPSAVPTTHARIYVDTSGGHDTGLAIANPSGWPMTVALSAFQADGVTPAGSSNGSVQLSGSGHTAAFAGQFITGLPAGFTGVLDISAAQPFAALTLRLLNNARGDTLLTTFPIADFNQTPVAPLVFPQIANGGGYQTQFILLNTSGSVSTVTVNFAGDNGTPIAVGKTEHDR